MKNSSMKTHGLCFKFNSSGFIFNFIPFLVLFFLPGCLKPQVRTEAGKKSALIFGYLDMSKSPYRLQSVTLTQGERSGIAYRQSGMVTLKNGLFYMKDLPPMEYHVPFFRAGGKTHMFSTSKKDVIRVRPGSINYWGGYRYKVHKKDMAQVLQLKPEQYGLVKLRGRKKRVLRMLLNAVKDPVWRKKIKRLL